MAIFNKPIIFPDRHEAGILLGEKLSIYRNQHPVVLALPRGGVPVAFEVARLLVAPLDVFVVRKLGAPDNPEFGIGAISEGGTIYFDKDTILRLGISQTDLLEIIKTEKEEVERRAELYRAGRRLLSVKNKTVILVDDGLATGVTGKAAIKALKRLKPKKIIFAVPVCSAQTADNLAKKVSLTCLTKPYAMRAIGMYYENFNQTSDKEVISLLQQAANNNN